MRRSMTMAAAAAAIAMFSVPDAALGAAGEATIEVLSNRADLVSGGDALVRVAPPAGARVGRSTAATSRPRSPCARTAATSGSSTGLRDGRQRR